MFSKTKHAFENSLKHLNNIVAPIGIVLIIKDFQQALGFLMINPIIALGIFSLFVGVFIYSLYTAKHSKTDSKALSKSSQQSSPQLSEEAKKTASVGKRKRSSNYKIISVTIASIGLALVAISIYIGSHVGLHYPLIQSFSSKSDTIDKVKEINKYLEEKGIDDIKATYIKSWANDFYGVILNGYSLSEEKAENEFKRAKIVMPKLLFTHPNNPNDTSRVAHIFWGPLKK